ncbi:MAG: malto-oligosyltrehalose trehalohydrolase [Polyangiaceae bacterium]|nr:malto-oligosyltrehalose trehalohydrolase [Polyangiaceae bacterium]
MRSRDPTGGLLGPRVVPGGTRFGAYSTTAKRCEVRLYDALGVVQGTHPMKSQGSGFFLRELEGVRGGQRYQFVLDGREVPDPYARFLPDGVDGPAMVVSSTYAWQTSGGPSRPLAEQVVYELHVGTFTAEGTYAAARARLPDLAALGITTLELMPVSTFAGERGWGYDGVAHFAPFAPYGHPDELRRFVDEAHRVGIAVWLDVVYNHFGPAGNYLAAFSDRYLTRDFVTPWGEAPDFRQDPMRRYVIDNARYWIEEFRFDGLRLDATHAIHDPSPVHILRDLGEVVRRAAPGTVLVAEDGRNDPALITELGCSGVWADDFHHHVRVTLTGEREGYYAAYEPGVAELARVIERGFSYEGQRYPPTGMPRGYPAESLDAEHFFYCIQNHDQIGNRALGSRLCHDVGEDAYCLASALLLFLPMTPLLFMGQEWAASSPFLYFTDHEAHLGELVTQGRRREFSAFAAFTDPAQRDLIPDPQALATFERSRLAWDERGREPHRRVLALYQALLALRRDDPVFRQTQSRRSLRVSTQGEVLVVERRPVEGHESRILVANFGPTPAALQEVPAVPERWESVLATRSLAEARVPPASAAILACRCE